MKNLEEEAEKWVFETNGHKWSNNDDTAGDNYGSFIAGAKSKYAQTKRIESELETLKLIKQIGLSAIPVLIESLEKELKELENDQ